MRHNHISVETNFQIFFLNFKCISLSHLPNNVSFSFVFSMDVPTKFFNK